MRRSMSCYESTCFTGTKVRHESENKRSEARHRGTCRERVSGESESESEIGKRFTGSRKEEEGGTEKGGKEGGRRTGPRARGIPG